MHVLNAALMGAQQPPFEERRDIVDAWHHHVSRIGTVANHGDLMIVAGCRQPGIPTPTVGVDQRPGVINPRDKISGVLHPAWLTPKRTGVKRIPCCAKMKLRPSLATVVTIARPSHCPC